MVMMMIIIIINVFWVALPIISCVFRDVLGDMEMIGYDCICDFGTVAFYSFAAFTTAAQQVLRNPTCQAVAESPQSFSLGIPRKSISRAQ